MTQMVYKIVTQDQWREAGLKGRFDGAPVDLEDGFIHLSTAAQAAGTAARHFAGRHDLLLVAFDGAALGEALRYRARARRRSFPPPLRAASIRGLHYGFNRCPWVGDGKHQFPDLDP